MGYPAGRDWVCKKVHLNNQHGVVTLVAEDSGLGVYFGINNNHWYSKSIYMMTFMLAAAQFVISTIVNVRDESVGGSTPGVRLT